ncbi:MAG: cell division protein ZapB [Thermoguttaceae bacterium]|jgi:molecular chaperone GrpE (heat shock protein)|nr:cell division protein ZapB [Thermoguttaceae bacterium]
MWKALKRVLGRPPGTGAEEADVLSLRRQIQELRLEAAERQRRLAVLETDLQRAQAGQKSSAEQAVQARIEQLLAACAPAVSQLVTQAHLVEVGGVSVPALDVLRVARRLVRALEDHGLEIDRQPGAAVAFDPACHEPISHDTAIRPGEPALVRFVGVRYQGKVLRKAGVAPA